MLTPRISNLPSLRRTQPLQQKRTLTPLRGTPSKVPSRDCFCPHCLSQISIPSIACSTLCRHCGNYISLEDYELKPGTMRNRICTLGKVKILDQTNLKHADISCSGMQVWGSIQGRISCSHMLEFMSSNRFSGQIQAAGMHIAKNVAMEFLGEVHVGHLRISGVCVTRKIHAERITVERNATLLADVECQQLVLKNGAVHRGKVKIIEPEPYLPE